MKIYNFFTPAFRAVLFSLLLLIVSNQVMANGSDEPVFAQLSSLKTQVVGKSLHGIVSFENIDTNSGVSIENNKTIFINEPGAYVIALSGQVGTTGLNIRGNVDIWLQHNGKNIPHAHSGQGINGNFSYNVGLQTVLYLNHGDTITVAFSADTQTAGFLANVGTNPAQTLIPSVLFTIYKIGSTNN